MDIYVFDTNFNQIGVLDNYKSCIWTTKIFTNGDFELYIPATSEALSLLKEKYYLVREQDITKDAFKNVMIIESIKITTSIDEGDHVIVSGRCLKSLLARRIIIHQTIITGQLKDCIRELINENVIEPDDSDRKINNFVITDFPTLINMTDSVNFQNIGDSLLTVIESLTSSYGVGWDVYVNANKEFTFDLFKTHDRSSRQSDNAIVVFSSEFDNLLNSEYSKDASVYKNVAVVAGEGEGNKRKKYQTGTARGLNRYEVFVDARDISTNEGEISLAEYNSMLNEKGVETLNEYAVTEAFEGEADTTRNFVLNKDFYLGDVVEIVNDYGMSSTVRVTEIIETVDDTGNTIIPTFSSEEV